MKELFITLLIAVQGFLGFGSEPVQEPILGASVLQSNQGGTGTSTKPTADQILIGGDTASRYDVKTLTAGSNITLATSSGRVTISSTASGGSGGADFPNVQAWGNSTSTTLGFLNGFLSTASSTISAALQLSSLSQGFTYVGSNSLLSSAASSSLFGYTPLNPTRQLTIAGTANQITSSAGAQDLSADRTWTLSFPNQAIFPQYASSTLGFSTPYASSTDGFFGTASSSVLNVLSSVNLFGGGAKTTANALCVQLTGHADLCDGGDATGAGGGSSKWATSTDAMTIYPSGGITTGVVIGATATTSANSTLEVNGYVDATRIRTYNETGENTYISLSENAISSVVGASTNFSLTSTLYNINPVQDSNFDFQVESNASPHAIFMDGSTGSALGFTGFATGTPVYQITGFNSTSPQLALSAGAGLSQWTLRNAGGSFYLATTSVNGLSTSTVSAMTINSDNIVRFGNNNATCIALTGSSALCDGSDDGAGGSSGYGFIQDTYGGNVVQSTTTTLWLKDITQYGLIASTTLIDYASTTQLSIGTDWLTDADGTGLTISATGVLNVDASQNITTLSNLTTNGFITTTGGTGALSVTTLPIGYASGGTGSTTAPVGQILYGGTSSYQSAATTSLTATAPIALSNAISVIGNTASAISCATASGSVAGCLSTADWTTFNNSLDSYDAFTHSSIFLPTSATTSKIGIGTTTPYYSLTVASTTGSQLALSDGTAGISQWTMRNAGGNLYVSTTTVDGTATSSLSALSIIGSNGRVGIASSSPMDALSVMGTTTFYGNTAHFGKASCGTGGLYQYGLEGIEVCGDNNNTGGGVQVIVDNNNSGANAWGGLNINNNLADNTLTHFFGMFYNSSNYTDTSFGTAIGIKNMGLVQNTDGVLALISSTSTEALNPAGIEFYTGGTTAGVTGTGNQRGKITFDGYWGMATSTPKGTVLTIASTTQPQLSLSAGAGIAQWTQRNAGGNLYFSTTTVGGNATTSISALEISGSGFGTTTVRGLNISGQATSTSNVGLKLTGGRFQVDALNAASCDLKASTDGTFYCGTDADSGGATAWNAIGDAAADGAIGMVETAQTMDWDTGAAASLGVDYLTLTTQNDAASDVSTQRLLTLTNKAASTNAIEVMQRIQNLDAVAVGTALLIDGTAITTAIDLSDADIVTALSVGANDITGTSWSITGASGLISSSYSSSTIYSSFITASSTNMFTGFLTLSTSTPGFLKINSNGTAVSSHISTTTVVSLDCNMPKTSSSDFAPGGAWWAPMDMTVDLVSQGAWTFQEATSSEVTCIAKIPRNTNSISSATVYTAVTSTSTSALNFALDIDVYAFNSASATIDPAGTAITNILAGSTTAAHRFTSNTVAFTSVSTTTSTSISLPNTNTILVRYRRYGADADDTSNSDMYMWDQWLELTTTSN